MTVFLRMVIAVGFIANFQSAGATQELADCKDYDVFVMRHLDKELGSSDDPELSSKGLQQAKKLSELDIMKSVEHAFYTPFNRTFQSLSYIDVSKTAYQPGATKHLVNTIKADYCGKSVLVVGHSNTVPSIIKALGGKFSVSYADSPLYKTPEIILNESDYGSIFRVTFHNGRLHQQLYRITLQNRHVD
ncbi:phosphoglycerate mutase family protein [Kangiella shandongensis]|uniref:phosphoglycerate mutase family protein n=1 Tax=Kangiella shandongensis TaxID=2763258 RepID=UPI001CBF03F1|nr:phosphoglycerate mutase family protein [Kangiella shandongensis]